MFLATVVEVHLKGNLAIVSNRLIGHEGVVNKVRTSSVNPADVGADVARILMSTIPMLSVWDAAGDEQATVDELAFSGDRAAAYASLRRLSQGD